MTIVIKGIFVAYSGKVYGFRNTEQAYVFYDCVNGGGSVESCSVDNRPSSVEVDVGQLNVSPEHDSCSLEP